MAPVSWSMYAQKLINRQERKGRPSTSSGRTVVGKLSEERFGGRGLGVLLARAFRGRFPKVRHGNPDGEDRSMMRAGAGNHFIDGGAETAGSGQFLQRRLGMFGGPNLLVEIRAPGPQDKLLGDGEAPVEQQRADERFRDVADDILALRGMIVARLTAKLDQRGHPKLTADFRTGFARHESVVAPRQLAFRLL